MGLGAGQIVYAADLAGLRPGLYFKGAGTTRNNTAAFADDPDLSNIPLSPGFYSILLVIYTTNANQAAKLKTKWVYTGSWTSPLRGITGAGNTNTADPTVTTIVNMAGTDAATAVVYSYAVSGSWAKMEERADRVEILSSGNLSLQWAQNAATAANTIVQPGSYFKVTKIDDL